MIKIPVYEPWAKEDVGDGSNWEERAERNGQLHALALMKHGDNPGEGAYARGRKDGKKNTFPSQKDADHRQKFNIAAPHTFLVGNQIVG